MYNGRRTVSFLPPGRCRTGARDYQHDYQQKTKQRAHVLSSSCSRHPAVSRQCAIFSWFLFLILTSYFLLLTSYFLLFTSPPHTSSASFPRPIHSTSLRLTPPLERCEMKSLPSQ